MLRTFAVLLALSGAATAQDKPATSLADLPQTLRTIMGCAPNWRGKDACEGERVWASIDKSGEITLFMEVRGGGGGINASGSTVDEVVRALAAKINANSASNAAVIKRMAPLLPTQ